MNILMVDLHLFAFNCNESLAQRKFLVVKF